VGHFVKILAVVMLLVNLSPTSAEARSLNMCTHMGFEPYVISSKNSLSGIDIDIVLALLNNLKQPAEIKAYPWKRLIAEIENGTCDMAFSLFDTDERRAFADYLFTVPIHYSTFSVFVKRNTNLHFNRISDFFNLKIAHNRGFALSIGFEQAIADGKIKRMLFDNADSAIKMLANGRIHAIIDNEARFRYYLKKQNMLGQIKSLTIPFMPHRPAFLVVSRQSDMPGLDKIKARFERELKKLHLNGTILEITSKYLN